MTPRKSKRKGPAVLLLSISGFSLIEMVVVVAIIAILGAILFPVIESASEAAKRAICRENLAQIGVAYDLYAGDHGGFFPSGGDVDYPCTFYSVSPTGSFIPGAYFLLLDGYISGEQETGTLSPYPSEEIARVFFCPSYVANFAGASPADILYQTGGGGYVFWGGWPPSEGLYHSVQTVHDPGYRVLMGDCIDTTTELRNRNHLLTKNNAAGANWLFLDGHVEWIPIAKLTQSQSLAGETYLLPDTP